MTSISLHADDLILFAHIIEAGSFTLAAERIGFPKATLSRRMTALERALGERLMQRSTRRLALTEFGERMLQHAQRLMDENDEVVALAQNQQATPHGTLRVSLPPEYREFFVAELVTRFSALYPEVSLELDLSARRVDLAAERFDVAVRAASRLPDDTTLVARPVCILRHGLFASDDYIRRHGRPQAPAELLDHAALMLTTGGGRPQPWELSCDAQSWSGIPARTLAANSVGLLQELAAQGLGIVGLSERFARDQVLQGLLEPVLPQWCLPSVTVWCVTPGRRLLPRRTVAFIEVLKVVLGDGEDRGRGQEVPYPSATAGGRAGRVRRDGA